MSNYRFRSTRLFRPIPGLRTAGNASAEAGDGASALLPPEILGTEMTRGWPLRRLPAYSLPVLAVLVVAAALLWLLPVDPVQAQDEAGPKITAGPAIASSPARNDTYRAGETITVAVTFSGPVVVTGEPRLRLQVGEERRWAAYESASEDGATLNFAYVVMADDRDDDGVSLKKNALDLNGGKIEDADGNRARVRHGNVPDQAAHKVNGASDAPEPEPTPTPTPEPPANNEPQFPDATAARSVNENAAAGENVGAAVTAEDADSDTLTYALTGADAGAFDFDASTGQIQVKDALDYEAKAGYTVTVTVHDGKNAAGEDDTNVDDTIAVTVSVLNVEEAGTVTLDPSTPQADSALTATLTDPDGGVTGLAWAWERSADRSQWTAIAGATAAAYTPANDDVDHYLRATASYADGEGAGKTAQATTAAPIPTLLPGQYPIADSGIGAYYEVNRAGINIKWANPDDGSRYRLALKTAGSNTWNIYYGGHDIGSASVELAEFNLSKTDTLRGRFWKYAKDGSFVKTYSQFTIDLSTVEFPPPNYQPHFTDKTAARSVNEDTAAGENVGAAVSAENGDDDALTYALIGADSGTFDFDAATGQITVKDALDYEAKAGYTLTVTVHDGKDAAGKADSGVDASIAVTVTVINADEAGTVALDPSTPQLGSQLTATLSDPDGGVTDVTWAWERSTDHTTVERHCGRAPSRLHSGHRRRREVPAGHGELHRWVRPRQDRPGDDRQPSNCAAPRTASHRGF